MIGLVDVYSRPDAARVLFDLLAERTPAQSISHKAMPSFEAHCAFVASRPYEAWYLIEDAIAPDERVPTIVGAIYLTQAREVGLFVFDRYRGRGYGSVALAGLRRLHPGRILANVSPHNQASQRFFARKGARLIQVTYELP